MRRPRCIGTRAALEDLATSATGYPRQDIFATMTTLDSVTRASTACHPLVAAAKSGTLHEWYPDDVLFVLAQQRAMWAADRRRRGDEVVDVVHPCTGASWHDAVEWVEQCGAPALARRVPEVLWRMRDGDLEDAYRERASGRLDGWVLRLLPYYRLPKGGAVATAGDHTRDPATVPRSCVTTFEYDDEDNGGGSAVVSAMVGLSSRGWPVYGTCTMRRGGADFVYTKRQRSGGRGCERAVSFKRRQRTGRLAAGAP